jgi:uncharacterized protein YneF (UPF0154 family)
MTASRVVLMLALAVLAGIVSGCTDSKSAFEKYVSEIPPCPDAGLSSFSLPEGTPESDRDVVRAAFHVQGYAPVDYRTDKWSGHDHWVGYCPQVPS